MNTEIHNSSHPRLPSPSAYSRYLDKVTEAEEKMRMRRQRIQWAVIIVGSTILSWSAVIIWLHLH